mmetsp:Transcript_58529/g.117531  ORF Transcript_58529/g.117531 Transcript_58529/m.117531 type:complete len:211 (-) Transcript_58529:45-677(-)
MLDAGFRGKREGLPQENSVLNIQVRERNPAPGKGPFIGPDVCALEEGPHHRLADHHPYQAHSLHPGVQRYDGLPLDGWVGAELLAARPKTNVLEVRNGACWVPNNSVFLVAKHGLVPARPDLLPSPPQANGGAIVGQQRAHPRNRVVLLVEPTANFNVSGQQRHRGSAVQGHVEDSVVVAEPSTVVSAGFIGHHSLPGADLIGPQRFVQG